MRETYHVRRALPSTFAAMGRIIYHQKIGLLPPGFVRGIMS
jgi:hypothetical protein